MSSFDFSDFIRGMNIYRYATVFIFPIPEPLTIPRAGAVVGAVPIAYMVSATGTA
jgi:hypothetical protein